MKEAYEAIETGNAKEPPTPEPEHHSHRTDEEWRAKVRGWKEKLWNLRVYANQTGLPGDLTPIINEMEKDSQ
jgi:hypothetical protein